jgi:peptide/nickel transport system ATP-binding protein
MSGPAAPLGPLSSGDVVLRADHVSVSYAGPRPVRAVRDVSLELRRGEVLGIVGESGCGKSTLAYALSRLLRPPAVMTDGTVHFAGRDGLETELTALDGEQLRTFRSTRIAMVFQSAMNALNPVASVGRQFRDIFRAHAAGMDRAGTDARAGDLLEMVGIDRGRLRSYPHELSGGMRQRVVIAMALALEPEVVIMDEPTTALDVVVQQEILDEIERLREALGFSIIFITHDLSLLLEISDTLAVMYAGRIVEYAPSEKVSVAPAHPYTLGLLRSFPDMRGERRELRGVPGSPPDLREHIEGCAFAPRCGYAFESCRTVPPALLPVTDRPDAASPRAGDVWRVACHLHVPGRYPQGPPDELSGAALAGPAARSGGAATGAAAGTGTATGTAAAGETAGGVMR